MIRLPRLADTNVNYRRTKPAPAPLSTYAKVYWTAGNALMLVGIVVLLYVGGLYANEEYGRYAARGDTDVPAPVVVAEPGLVEPAPFIAPRLNTTSETMAAREQVVSDVPSAAQVVHPSTVTRIIIPSIGVDSKVVEVGWDVQEQDGQQVAVWQVAKYAVGQHKGSANPGENDNIVLAGHVGGYGKVFKDLFYVQPGDQITLYSNGEQYLYTVRDRLVVTEEGVPPEQHAENARLIGPTGHELVTLVTCWPPTGPNKFTQRVVVRAVPFTTGTPDNPSGSNWSIR